MNDDDPADYLRQLKRFHRELDEELERMRTAGNCDPMELARLKKRKLAIKDEIQLRAGQLIPDIIA